MTVPTTPVFPDTAASATPLPAWATRPPSPFTPVRLAIVQPMWWRMLMFWLGDRG